MICKKWPGCTFLEIYQMQELQSSDYKIHGVLRTGKLGPLQTKMCRISPITPFKPKLGISALLFLNV